MWTYNYTNSDYIQHYGILGMRWGIRRFQDKSGRLTSAGKKRYDDDPSNGKPGSSSKTTKTDKEVGDSFVERKLGIKLSDTQKKVLKTGAIIAGVAIAAYGGYRLYNSDIGKPVRDQVNLLIDRFNESNDRATFKNTGKLTEHAKKDLSSREYDSKLQFFKKGREYTPDEDLLAINEGMFRRTKGGSNNCGLCTTAYELRRRGYDVRANFSEEGRSVQALADYFKNAKIQDDRSFVGRSRQEWMKHVEKEILKQGNGARGNFGGQYPFGGGHSIIYEVVDNKVVFRDGQVGRTYNSTTEAIGRFLPGSSHWFRMDDLEINQDNIKNAVSTFGLPRVNTNIMESDPVVAREMRKMVVAIRKGYKQQHNMDISLQTARKLVRDMYNVKV